MVMAKTEADLSAGAELFKSHLRDVQRAGITAVAPGMFVFAALLMVIQEKVGTDLSYLWPANILIAFSFVVWILRERSYRAAVWIVVAGCTIAPLLLMTWGSTGEAIVLLALPVGLVALFVSLLWASLVALAATAFVAFHPVVSLYANELLRAMTILQIWGLLGLIALAMRPLLTAVAWSWSSYERSRTLLEQAREYQVQLRQSLEDLATVNSQLARLNEFAQRMRLAAEEAKRAKEQFVANVSHELRTPLNMIIGFSELITSSPESYGVNLPPALLADLQVILRNSRHLAELIDDVLDLSQIEAGRMAITKEWVNLAEIIGEAKIAVQQLFVSKGLYLKTDIPEDLPLILCDRTRVREVILNVLSNAARFTEKGGVHIRVWQQGNDVVVAVADTGPGIPREALERLFQPFEQVDMTIRRRYGGSGLGLSISKAFIELHGGSMWIESAVGHGSTVFFRLPTGATMPVHGDVGRWLTPEWEYRQRTRPSIAPRPTIRPRLVVVETGETLHRMLNRYTADADIVSFSSLSEALTDLASTPAQALIVNEVSVPYALQRLTTQSALPPGIPIIVCSIPEASDVVETLGASDYLVKPIAPERLIAALDRLDLAGKTVLVVDDEPEACRLFMRLLTTSGRGYRVLRAESGHEALRILRGKRKPDVVLLDLVMPDMDGFRVLAECKNDPDLRAIPIVVISARDPTGHPIVSNALAVTMCGGLTSGQILAMIEAIQSILAPAMRQRDREQRETLSD